MKVCRCCILLATSPATAKFISTKLGSAVCERYGALRRWWTGWPRRLQRAAETSRQCCGRCSIRRSFWSPEVYRAKMKTPLEFVASAVAGERCGGGESMPLVQSLDKLGMPLYGMQTPNGYSWMAEPWVNTGDLVNRMNFALGLSSDRIPGVQTDWTRLLGQQGGSMEPAALTTEQQMQRRAAKEQKLEMLLPWTGGEGDRTPIDGAAAVSGQEMQQQATRNFAIKAE